MRSCAWGDASTLSVLLGHLRKVGAIPAPEPSILRGFVDILEWDYEQFLLQERGLVGGTVGVYLPVVQRFLEHRFPTGKIHLGRLHAGDAADFILHASPDTDADISSWPAAPCGVSSAFFSNAGESPPRWQVLFPPSPAGD
jgi:hypothetical protein